MLGHLCGLLALTIVPPSGQSITLCSDSRSVEFSFELVTDAHLFSCCCASEIPDIEFRRITDQRM